MKNTELRNFLLLLLSLVGMSTPALSQDSRAWMSRVATDPPGPFRDLRPMEASYSLTWKGKVNAGKMNFAMTQPMAGVLCSQASGKSVGLARALFPYDFSGTAQTNAETFKPLNFKFQDQMKDKAYKYAIFFQPSQMVSQTDYTNLKTGRVTPHRKVYHFEKDIGLDMISSLLYLRSLSLSKGQKVSLIVATFNTPYLADFTVLGKETKTFNGNRYDSIKIDVDVSRIRTDMTIEPYSKVEKATIWISDDAFRIPLEFQGDIFVGYISAQLASRRWL